jgi:hypothetical protein
MQQCGQFGAQEVIHDTCALEALPVDPTGLLVVDRVAGLGGHEVDPAVETMCAALPPASCGQRWSSRGGGTGWGAACAIPALLSTGRFGGTSSNCVK